MLICLLYLDHSSEHCQQQQSTFFFHLSNKNKYKEYSSKNLSLSEILTKNVNHRTEFAKFLCTK